MLLIGHRGCNYSGFNQNTLRAFTRVIDEGVAAIEFDVQLTSDNLPVVVHNLDLEEVSTGTGLVNKTDSQKLRTFYAGDPKQGKDRIPFLAEVFDLFAEIPAGKRPRLHMELKGDGSGKPAGILAKEYITAGRLKPENFLISSFNWDELLVIRTVLPEIDIALLDGAIRRKNLLTKIETEPGTTASIARIKSFFAEIFSYGCEDYMLPRSARLEDELKFLAQKCTEKQIDKKLHDILAEEISLCLAGGYYTDELLQTACTMEAVSINLWHKTVSEEFVAKAHARGLKMLVYTANTKEDLLAAARCGVDGIFTDYYMQAAEILGEE